MAYMSPLSQVQSEMTAWQQHNFPNREPWIPLLGAGEELGELFHAYIKRHQGIRGTPEEHAAAMEDALGDILIYLTDFANSQGISLEEALVKTWLQVSKRDWKRYPLTGCPSPAQNG